MAKIGSRLSWRKATLPLLKFAFQRIQARGQATPGLLRMARFAWGNYFYSADLDYLGAVWRAAGESGGNVLECGSGLSTLLLGLTGDRRGLVIHTLENNAEWAEQITSLLNSLRIRSVRVHCAPLRDYGTFEWYQAPAGLPPVFDLVVCDGPRTRTTRGGRYGLLPIMREHITSRTVLLMDDAERPDERQVIERWRREFPLEWDLAPLAAKTYRILTHAGGGFSPAPGGHPYGSGIRSRGA